MSALIVHRPRGRASAASFGDQVNRPSMTRPSEGAPDPRGERREEWEWEREWELDSNKRGRRGHRARGTGQRIDTRPEPRDRGLIAVRAKLLPLHPMSSQLIPTFPGTPGCSLAVRLQPHHAPARSEICFQQGPHPVSCFDWQAGVIFGCCRPAPCASPLACSSRLCSFLCSLALTPADGT